MHESKDKFAKSIKEVEYLNSICKKETKYDYIFFKAIILLLSAKLEKFVKDSTKEYINELISYNVTNKNIPIKLIKEIINNELKKIENITLDNYIAPNKQHKKRAKVFSLIWDDTYHLSELNVDEFLISISKNGSNGIKEVYSKIGLSNIIFSIPDYCQFDGFTQINYSVVNRIDYIIYLRNNIIHEDVNPIITYQDNELNIRIIKHFVSKVNQKLNHSLKLIKKSIL